MPQQPTAEMMPPVPGGVGPGVDPAMLAMLAGQQGGQPPLPPI